MTVNIGMSALSWDGRQGDLWDNDDEMEAALESTQAMSRLLDEPGGEDGLFPLAAAGSRRLSASENPACRILSQPAATLLQSHDAKKSPALAGERNAEVLFRIRQPHIGHLFIVAATIEREFRRVERALRLLARRTPSVRPDDEGVELRALLSNDPIPMPIKVSGLRVSTITSSDDVVEMQMTGTTSSLTRFPAFTLAFAMASVADQRLSVSTFDTRLDIELELLRMKAIAGGLPAGSVTVAVDVWAERGRIGVSASI